MARPFHFTIDPDPFFTKSDDGGTGTWVQSGTVWTVTTAGATNSRQIRDTDTATDQTVHGRGKHTNVSGSNSFGLVANYTNASNFYLFIAEPGTWSLYVVSGGAYNLVGSAAVTISNNTYYVLKMTTANSGSDKVINCYANGTLVIGPITTATQFGNLPGGMWHRDTTSAATGTWDWWAFNTAPVISSATSVPTTGGTSTITGTDFGDGTLTYLDGTLATATVTPNTSIAATAPASATGVKEVDVTVKFGTSGSEEYTYTLSGGLFYVTSTTKLISEHRHSVFRNLLFKRRLSSGEYESSWQTIPSKYIKSFGTLRWNWDNVIAGVYQQSGMRVMLRNDDAFFNEETDVDSFFYPYLSRYRTLVRVEAGYQDSMGNYYPSDPTLFTGIINSEFKRNDKNEIPIEIDTLDSIFREVPASKLQNFNPAGETATSYIQKIRDFTDGANNFFFRKFIALADWTIASTTLTYPSLNTSTALQNDTCWSLIQKLAQIENKVAYVNKTGQFFFADRPQATTTSTVVYGLRGVGARDKTYGHNIISLDNYYEAVSKIYNRVSVKHKEADTSESYYIKEQSWSWGDGSTSDKYGVRTYNVDNTWIDITSTAITLGDALFNAYSALRYEADITCKFIPHVFLGDFIDVTYKSPAPPVLDIWGYFTWGVGVWGRSTPRGFSTFNNKQFYVIGLEHDLDGFKTRFNLREV